MLKKLLNILAWFLFAVFALCSCGHALKTNDQSSSLKDQSSSPQDQSSSQAVKIENPVTSAASSIAPSSPSSLSVSTASPSAGRQTTSLQEDENTKTVTPVIEERYGITLPKNHQVIKSTIDEDACYAKILISKSDVEPFVTGLKNYIKKEIIIEQIPDRNLNLDWWDMDKGSVIYSFIRFQSNPLQPGRSVPKSIESDIFIANSTHNDALIYLYMPYKVGSYIKSSDG